MLNGLIGGLIVAFLLSIFNFDKMFCDFFYEMFNAKISSSTYYVIFAITGLLGEILDKGL